MIGKQLGGVMPTPGAFSETDKTILAAADAMIGKAREAMKTQALHQVLNAVWAVVADANRYFAGEAPWALAKTDPARQGTVLYVTAEVIRQVAILAQPFMPTSAGEAARFAGDSGRRTGLRGARRRARASRPARRCRRPRRCSRATSSRKKKRAEIHGSPRNRKRHCPVRDKCRKLPRGIHERFREPDQAFARHSRSGTATPIAAATRPGSTKMGAATQRTRAPSPHRPARSQERERASVLFEASRDR